MSGFTHKSQVERIPYCGTCCIALKKQYKLAIIVLGETKKGEKNDDFDWYCEKCGRVNGAKKEDVPS